MTRKVGRHVGCKVMLLTLCCMLFKRCVSSMEEDCHYNNSNLNHKKSSASSLWKWLVHNHTRGSSSEQQRRRFHPSISSLLPPPPPPPPLPRWFQQYDQKSSAGDSLPSLPKLVISLDNEDSSGPHHLHQHDTSLGGEWDSFVEEKNVNQRCRTETSETSEYQLHPASCGPNASASVGCSDDGKAIDATTQTEYGNASTTSSLLSSSSTEETTPETSVCATSDLNSSNETTIQTAVNETTSETTNSDNSNGEPFCSHWTGCIDIDLRGVNIYRGGVRPSQATRTASSSRRVTTVNSDSNSCEVQLDPQSLIRLVQLSGSALYCFGSAFLGTLRWLAPLIVGRRILNWIGENVILDWYRGYYLRTTYRRMEEQYLRYYQGPAILRSLGRLVSQIVLLMTLGRIMEWMVGLSHAPCLIEAPIVSYAETVWQSGITGAGCHWWCGLLWLFAVVGTGHAGAVAIAVWGGPLRIQAFAPYDHHPLRPPSARNIFTRPWRLLRWMRDPDKWIRSIANTTPRFYSSEPLRPFQPDALLFPATWEPLRLMMMIGVAREMTCNRRMMHALMRSVLIQQSFADEWYRVLMVEKRVALGILLMAGVLMSSLVLFRTVTRANDGISISFLLPYLFSVIISGYMNIFFYNDIRQTKKQAADSRKPAEFWLQGKFVVQSVQW